MSKIYLFRGKAATGKTTITNLLCKKLNIVILRKDDIYDKLSLCNLDHSVNNHASYEVLASIIQTNVDLNCDIIIDIGLAHKAHIKEFLSKVNWRNSKIHNFLCICSDNRIWRKRIKERLKNPLPNQSFCSSISEMEIHYKKYDITPLENEIVLDSVDELSDIIKTVCKTIVQ